MKIKNVISSTEIVEAGVPQGSILGPILFIAFTSDFHEHLAEYKVSAYADDTQIIITSNCEQDLIKKVEDCIARAQLWYASNSLKINPTKTEVLIFGRKRKHKDALKFSVTEGNNTSYIESVRKMKILGVHIDDDLSWESHVKSVKAKTYNIIRNLARTTSVLPLKSKRQLYDALVTPHFSYCDTVWGGLSKRATADLQKAGNFAAKSMLGQRKRASATEALNKLNMMPLEEKRRVHMGVFVHKLKHNIGPTKLVERYNNMVNSGHKHHTRFKARGDMMALSHNSSRFEKSTLMRAAQVWNGIPCHIRNLEGSSNFKRKYQAYLLDNFKKQSTAPGSRQQ